MRVLIGLRYCLVVFAALYLDHLIPDVPLARGTAVTAGQRLGTTGSAYGIDLGVINQAVSLAFVNPSRYIAVFAIASGDRWPRDVSVGSGPIRYTLTRAITGRPASGTASSNTLLVQMLGDQRVQAELFPLGSAAGAFTPASRIFIR